jgi:hypothetical protein
VAVLKQRNQTMRGWRGRPTMKRGKEEECEVWGVRCEVWVCGNAKITATAETRTGSWKFLHLKMHGFIIWTHD